MTGFNQNADLLNSEGAGSSGVELDRLRDLLADTADWYDWHEASMEVVFAAARRFLALTETGRRVEWCVTHRNIAWEDFEEKPFDEFLSRGFRCPAGSWIEGAGAWDCSIEPTLIIPADYLTEEE